MALSVLYRRPVPNLNLVFQLANPIIVLKTPNVLQTLPLDRGLQVNVVQILPPRQKLWLEGACSTWPPRPLLLLLSTVELVSVSVLCAKPIEDVVFSLRRRHRAHRLLMAHKDRDEGVLSLF